MGDGVTGWVPRGVGGIGHGWQLRRVGDGVGPWEEEGTLKPPHFGPGELLPWSGCKVHLSWHVHPILSCLPGLASAEEDSPKHCREDNISL